MLNVSYFNIFSCTSYCLNNQPSHKFCANKKKRIFVIYSDTSNDFLVYFHRENRIINPRSVKFFEDYSDNRSKVGRLHAEIFVGRKMG